MMRQVRRRERASRILLLVLAGVLFTGLFMQIGWLSEISRQSKQNDALSREITELSATADNLRVALSRYHNLEIIQQKAEQLGMTLPDSSQIRVISLPIEMTQGTSAQTAAMNGGEEGAK